MAFGEYWDTCEYTDGVLNYNQDSHRQRTVNWCDKTGGTAAAFDFTTKGADSSSSPHHISLVYPATCTVSGLGPLCTMLKYWCRLCCWSGLPCAWAFSVCLAPYSSVSVQHEFDQGADACHTDVGSYPCFSCYLHSRSYPCDMCTNNVIRSAG